MNSFFKKSLLSFVVLFLLPVKIMFAQEKEVIKKIIIDPNPKERLLIPSIQNENEKIKLIPPKSILDKKTEKEKKRLRLLEKFKNKKEKHLKIREKKRLRLLENSGRKKKVS